MDRLALRRWLPPVVSWPIVAKELGITGARVVGSRGTPLGVELELRLRAPLTATALEQQTDKIAVALGVARCRVTPDDGRADRAVLGLDLKQGLGAIPYPSDDRPIWLPRAAGDRVPLGLDARGRPVALDVVGASVLVGGNPGSGKSSALRVLLAGLAQQRHVALVGVDPKWAELRPWSGRFSTLILGNEAQPVIEVLAALNDEIQRRARRLADHNRASWPISSEDPVVYLVIDEWAELAAAGTTKEQTEVNRLLRRFVAMGRAVGCGAVLATQRPTSDSIDTATKSLLAHRLALRCGDRYASEAILGPGQYGAADIPGTAPGRALLSAGFGVIDVQVFDLPHSDISEVATPALRAELGWLPHGP